MAAVDRLAGKIAPDLQAAARAFLRSGNASAFEAAMGRALTRGHTAAYMRGQADRLGVDLSAVRGLSNAERAELRQKLAEQLGYLRKFAQAAPDLSAAQLASRSAMYLGAMRSTYFGARWPGLPAYPGDGSTECLTNCQCHLEEGDGGIYWVLGPAEHCDGCRDMAAGSPYTS